MIATEMQEQGEGLQLFNIEYSAPLKTSWLKKRNSANNIANNHHHHAQEATTSSATPPTTTTAKPSAKNSSCCGIGIKQTHKPILRGITATIPNGSMCCVLGPSGSGKSTLLDFIASNVHTGVRKGACLYNGKPVKRGQIGYVTQDDILLPTDTVHETLLTAAFLRMGSETTRQEKFDRVSMIEKTTGLIECKNVKIGSTMIRGISGGQKRRVNVAIELLKNPQLLLMDEVTSGLDSFTSMRIIHTLKKVTKAQKKCVLATIHQPSTELFELFDYCLLLAEGRVIYMGPVKEAVDYCSRIGYPCPSHTNPADHLIHIVSTPLTPQKLEKNEVKQICSVAAQQEISEMIGEPHAAEVELGDASVSIDIKQNESSPNPTAETAASVEPSPVAQGAHEASVETSVFDEEVELSEQEILIRRAQQIEDLAVKFTTHSRYYVPKETALKQLAEIQHQKHPSTKHHHTGAPIHEQIFLLSLRFLRCTLRDPLSFWNELIQYITLAVFMGLMYLQRGSSPEDIQDKLTALFFVVTMVSYVPMFTVVSTFPSSRDLFVREKNAGLYGTLAYYLSYCVVHTPMEIIFPTVFSIISYWMIGFRASAGSFFIYLSILIIIQLLSEGLALFVSALVRSVDVANLYLSGILLVWQSASGFLTKNSRLGWYFYPFAYTSPFRYAFAALMRNEFEGVPFTCTQAAPCVYSSGDELVKAMDVDNMPTWGHILVIIGMTIVIRVAVYFALRFKKWNRK